MVSSLRVAPSQEAMAALLEPELILDWLKPRTAGPAAGYVGRAALCPVARYVAWALHIPPADVAVTSIEITLIIAGGHRVVYPISFTLSRFVRLVDLGKYQERVPLLLARALLRIAEDQRLADGAQVRLMQLRRQGKPLAEYGQLMESWRLVMVGGIF